MDTYGNIISRDFEISRENCQRSKVLSSDTQRIERLKLKKDIQDKELVKIGELDKDECEKYRLNLLCQDLVQATYIMATDNIPPVKNTNDLGVRLSFADMLPHLSAEHFGRHNYKGQSNKKPTCDHLKAFIQVRKQVIKYKNGTPVYGSLHNIKKDSLIDLCVGIRHDPIQPRLFPTEPPTPTKEPIILTDNIDMVDDQDGGGVGDPVLMDGVL